MTAGRTALIVKYSSKGNQLRSYGSITCLSLSWKTLMAIIAEKLYDHLKGQSIIGNKQKSCWRFTRGTKDHLLTDKAVLKNYKI